MTPTRVITASGESSLKVWDAKSPEHPLIHTFSDAHPLGVHHVVVDLDDGSTTAASSGFGQELVIWDLVEEKEKLRLQSGENGSRDIIGEAWALSLSPDGKTLYSTTHDGRVNVWDTLSLKKIAQIETKGSFGTSIACVRSPPF